MNKYEQKGLLLEETEALRPDLNPPPPRAEQRQETDSCFVWVVGRARSTGHDTV